jgi:hypothetical protein
MVFYPGPGKWSVYIIAGGVVEDGMSYDLLRETRKPGFKWEGDPKHFATGGIVQDGETGECFTIGGQA